MASSNHKKPRQNSSFIRLGSVLLSESGGRGKEKANVGHSTLTDSFGLLGSAASDLIESQLGAAPGSVEIIRSARPIPTKLPTLLREPAHFFESDSRRRAMGWRAERRMIFMRVSLRENDI